MGVNLNKIPFRQEMIPRGDERITPYTSDVLYHGEPDLVYRARDFRDLQEILRFCHKEKIPVTVSGSRTALTGSGVADGGVLVAMEKKDRLIDIGIDPQTEKPVAVAEPGILLGDFQRRIAEAGYFYPPDPTSRNEAQLGGTIGTNATGEDSLLYGPTRRYVRQLKILKANGDFIILERKKPYQGPWKNRGGYYLDGDLIDTFVGSEGTLGLMTEITVDLLPEGRDFFSGWAFFPDLSSAIHFCLEGQKRLPLKPRALELIDENSLKMIQKEEGIPKADPGGKVAVIFKQEYTDDENRHFLMGEWLRLIEEILRGKKGIRLVDAVVMALDRKTQNLFRKLRHAVPSFANEEAERYRREGGGKLSTDWWVPREKVEEMMREVVLESDRSGIRYLVYAHIGDGHPHINYLARNSDEKRKAGEILVRQCRRAVQMGGGVAGEHGIGKLWRNLLRIQSTAGEIKKMMEIKKEYDPHGILGRGNLFSC